MERLKKLLKAYDNAPEIFHATRYWKGAVEQTIKEIENADLNKMRSGKYRIFAKFGFYEFVYKNVYTTFFKRNAFKIISPIISQIPLPYFLQLQDIREMAFKHCLDVGKITNSLPITSIQTSTFGAPGDLFEIQGKKYTMMFLSYYLRYCFVNNYLKFKGDEIIVELGSGSGHQVEVLKKLYPGITILCFDLPSQLYLCEEYLKNALRPEDIVSADYTLELSSLNSIEKGKVYMFGNWQTPLLKDLKFDIFWNAASFGEMEPHVVKNYLSYVLDNANWIYLLQARKGKESFSNSGVEEPITFEAYNAMLNGYGVIAEEDAYYAHMRMRHSGGYFEAIWQKLTDKTHK